MNWDAIGAFGEVAGALVVIISVLYLARQVRLSAEQSQHSSSQAVDASGLTAFDPIYIPENNQIWTKGHSEPEPLMDHERQIFNILMVRVLIASFNTTSHYYSLGVYDGELYLRNAQYFRTLVETPGGKSWYAEHKHLMHPESCRRLGDQNDEIQPVI